MAVNTERDLHQLKNRFRELADKSYNQGIYTFTSFLGLSEQDTFWQCETDVRHAGFALYGGTENATRVVVRFGKEADLGYEVPFPIVCIHISPLQQKFADDLTHRDFLGALMNLGIDRSTLGDIKVGEKEAYLFCLESIAAFICENLCQVKHTHVKCVVTENVADIPEEEPKMVSVQVSGLRVDAVLAKTYNLSREKSLGLFVAGKVYVNGRLCENNSKLLKVGDTVNARGFGKFTVAGEPRETRKGKLAIEIAVYR